MDEDEFEDTEYEPRKKSKAQERRKPRGPEEVPDFDTLTDQQKEKLRKRAKNSALWHLDRGDRTQHWLETKLTRRGIPPQIIAETIEFLKEYSFVDDARYAKSFTEFKRETSGLSKNSLAWKLKREGGIDADVVEDALSSITNEDEEDMARELVRQKTRGGMRGVPQDKRFNRLVGMLSRKGYSASISYSIVTQALKDLDEEEAALQELEDSEE